jgi:hypothetical protein
MKDSEVEVGFSVTGSFWVDPERFTVEKDADGNVVALVPKLYGGMTAKYRLTLAIEIEDNPERFRVIYSEKTMAEECGLQALNYDSLDFQTGGQLDEAV